MAIAFDFKLEMLNKYPRSVWPGWVIKASGLAGGKGVVVTACRKDALSAIRQVKSAFREAAERVVVEELLCGVEVSVSKPLVVCVAEVGSSGATFKGAAWQSASLLQLAAASKLSPRAWPYKQLRGASFSQLNCAHKKFNIHPLQQSAGNWEEKATESSGASCVLFSKINLSYHCSGAGYSKITYERALRAVKST